VHSSEHLLFSEVATQKLGKWMICKTRVSRGGNQEIVYGAPAMSQAVNVKYNGYVSCRSHGGRDWQKRKSVGPMLPMKQWSSNRKNSVAKIDADSNCGSARNDFEPLDDVRSWTQFLGFWEWNILARQWGFHARLHLDIESQQWKLTIAGVKIYMDQENHYYHLLYSSLRRV